MRLFVRPILASVLGMLLLLTAMPEGKLHAVPAAHVMQQSDSHDPQEIFLSFSYRGTKSMVITALYHNDQVYLPVGELFDFLMIPYHTDTQSFVISGTYLSENQDYELHFDAEGDPRGRVGDREAAFGGQDFLIGELDFYLLPKHFEQLFGLNFTVDMNNLTLSLTTDNVLPIIQQMERQRRRNQITEQRERFDYYDLAFDRQRHFLRAGFADYALNTTLDPTGTNQYNYTLDVGGELLGGDVQGALYGGYNSSIGFQNYSDNLRWRFVPGNRNLVSNISVGQIRSGGLLTSSNFRGISISNEDIQPQILFQDYVIDGTTVPESEVEVYLNNSLIAFKTADMSGYYRFQIPITYGTTQLSLRIYRPDGTIETRSERIQIPYTYLRPGQVRYNASAGLAESSLLEDQDQYFQGQANAAVGIASWLTLRTGMDYLEADPAFQPLLYSSLSTRLASNFLFNLDLAPQAYYRADLSAVYPSSASLGATYTHYTRDRSLFNPTSIQRIFQGNIYLPFDLWGTPLSARLFGGYQQSRTTDQTQYRLDLSGRFGRMNVRLSIRDRQNGAVRPEFSNRANVSATASYVFPRGPATAGLLKGLYLRSQMDYNPHLNRITQASTQISKELGQNLRFQVSMGQNFLTNSLSGYVNLTFELNRVRATSTARMARNSVQFSQNLSGSVGYDGNYKELYFTNRRQVGQSAASVRLFLDENDSGTYNEGEEILPYNAVRLQRSGRTQLEEDGIIRVTQLQSYYRHNMEINYAALQNPTYVPKFDEFSFIADPNQFKPIDIPFYITGILEGMVYRQQDSGQRQPAAGVRIYMISEDGEFEKTFNTFSDGSFYTYEVPPGEYDMFIDPAQLQRLGAEAVPDTIDLKVESVEGGDYISGLEFTIVPEGTGRPEVITAADQDTAMDKQGLSPLDVYGEYNHSVQLASFSNFENADRALATAREQFNIPLTVSHTNDLYALRTHPIQNRQQAITLLHRIADSQFSQPVLVLTRNGNTAMQKGADPSETREVVSEVYSLQIGAFSRKQSAQQFVSGSENPLGEPASVVFDSTRGLYKVYANSHPFDSLERARNALTDLRSRPAFDNAFIDRRTVRRKIAAEHSSQDPDRSFTYEVHIQGVSDISRERFLSEAITSNFNLLSNGPKEELVVFQDIPDWQTAVDLIGKLRRIAGMGQPFIVLLETDNGE
ncbi:MAG: SPOR domain-containing protein [Balneolaceae bacterium]|nr:SPOR domain-containing protein [Balneolaceae bacterium]